MTDLPAWFPADLRTLLEADFPRFSATEQQRRRGAIAAAMQAAGVDHLLSYGANWQGTGTHWLTGWQTSSEAAVVHTPGQKDVLYVQYHNHLPLAAKVADAEVRWGGPVNNRDSTIRGAMQELANRGAKPGRVGVIGPLTFSQHRVLAEQFDDAVNFNPAYTALRLIKSEEELTWMRLGAAFGDLAITALQQNLCPGLAEHELGSIVEQSFSALGGRAGIHFFGVTPMAAPESVVPAQYTSWRRVQTGDAVVTEISADFWGYGGQVLRSFAVGSQPTQLYKDLHATADAAFNSILSVLRPGCTMQEIVAAAAIIEKNGFTTCDDLVHGYGGGYLQPVLGSASRPNGQLPDIVLKPNMCLVVQPNVTAPNHNAGIQTGECVRITQDGCVSIHSAPRGFLMV
jgi:Xaa-Pro dipeptidase